MEESKEETTAKLIIELREMREMVEKLAVQVLAIPGCKEIVTPDRMTQFSEIVKKWCGGNDMYGPAAFVAASALLMSSAQGAIKALEELASENVRSWKDL